PDRGDSAIAAERKRLCAVSQRTAGLRRPSVVTIEWADPVFAMGNWGPELVEAANGELLIGSKGEYSTSMPGERLAEADPEYLIVAPCGFGLERAMQERAVFERNSWWAKLRSVREGKVAFADGNLFFNRSGMTVVRTD